MLVVVWMIKVHLGADVADVSGVEIMQLYPGVGVGDVSDNCIDGVYTFTCGLMVMMSVVVQIVKVHPGVGDADVSSGRDSVGTP